MRYLATLGRRPAALDHSKVYCNWRLPEEFSELRQSLEQRQGALSSGRQYIRVLQLLAQHPIERVQRAIQSCRSPESHCADRIIQHTFRMAERDAGREMPSDGVDRTDPVMTVQVRMPDLRHFDQLLSQGEQAYG